MPTLLLRFPAGRYHATPWGHHVNEGLVEWPPSPWRLVRALLACGFATQQWADGVPQVGARLMRTLSDCLPAYRVPEASVGHSRHYMPLGTVDRGQEKTTLVFDAWADVGDGVMAVRWPCDVDDEGISLFRTLAANLGYLGRSESWVIAEAISDDDPMPAGSDVYPHRDGQRAGQGWEQTSLLAPEMSGAYDTWRVDAVDAALLPFPLQVGNREVSASLQTKRDKASAPFPGDVLACLLKDTSWWKKYGWSQPPGSRRVLYWRRTDALQVGPPRAVVRPGSSRPTAVLLALSRQAGTSGALPPVVRALPQAELLHRSLVARAGNGDAVDCPELTGRDEEGRPLKGHRHAHLLTMDLDDDGYLDHILIHCPMGLGTVAQSAIRAVRRTWTKGGAGPLRLAVAGQGELATLRGLSVPWDAGVTKLLGQLGGAKSWTSWTPYVLPRYPKAKGPNSVAGQIQAELASRGLPEATAIEVLPWDESNRQFRHAVRVRRHPAKRPPVDAAIAVRLTFGQSVEGPLTLGYGSHFGLGLFRAETEA